MDLVTAIVAVWLWPVVEVDPYTRPYLKLKGKVKSILTFTMLYPWTWWRKLNSCKTRANRSIDIYIYYFLMPRQRSGPCTGWSPNWLRRKDVDADMKVLSCRLKGSLSESIPKQVRDNVALVFTPTVVSEPINRWIWETPSSEEEFVTFLTV